MARQLRLEIPGSIWHVTSRGNEKRDIVRDDRDRHDFVRLLSEIVSECHWVLHSWVLMDNHYHLLIETPEPTLSEGVKWLNQTYVQRFNSRHRRVGHLFQGRFKGILVEREGHLLELIRYLVLNPVRSGMVRFAGDYRWSNYRATAGLAPPPGWLEVTWTLSQFGERDCASAHEAYRCFVADARGASYNPWELLQGQIYLGSDAFRAEMQKHVESLSRSAEHPLVQREIVVKRPEIDVIASQVAAVFELTIDDLRLRANRLARNALAVLATEEGWSLSQTGRWLQVTVPGARKMRDTGRRYFEAEPCYQKKVEEIRKKLTVKM